MCSVWIPTTDAPKTPLRLLKAQGSKGPAADGPLPPRVSLRDGGERDAADVQMRSSSDSEQGFCVEADLSDSGFRSSPDSPALHAAFPKRKLLAPSDEAVPRKRRCTSDMERRARRCDRRRITRPSGGGLKRLRCWKRSSPFSIDWRHTAISVINLSLINDFVEFVFTHREQKEKHGFVFSGINIHKYWN